MTASAGILSPGSVYELCVAALMGTTQKYWKSLVAHTDIKEKIDQALTVDGVLAIIADALKREFCGFSLSTETVEKEQSLTALVKLQICDMCWFDSYVCEFQKYYYNLDVVSQQFILETFFAKLPEPWPEVAQKAYELLLSEEKIVSGLGGKIQAVKYAMRKACTELQVKEAAKKLPYLNKSCCSQIEYVPGRYGCDTRNTSDKTLNQQIEYDESAQKIIEAFQDPPGLSEKEVGNPSSANNNNNNEGISQDSAPMQTGEDNCIKLDYDIFVGH
ncbi:hypothetical protein MLD38_037831 [Melastoma candidum]|uniref:Uncharacterized protein n=2 Tax=Melastoma candidum TaxID=119954 RepID=A0ACB9LQH8_9MYRT|nr:hypothetical protein MLD38_037830 [Melastoma candidum]KAI4313055.1 hypothetical protein MLD38_037831 [Melastoma candidum]